MFRYRPLTLALLAVLACGQAQAQSEDARTLLIQQGYFWQGQDKPERAAEVWNKVLLIDARQPDALYGLGLIEVQAGRLQEARGICSVCRCSRLCRVWRCCWSRTFA